MNKLENQFKEKLLEEKNRSFSKRLSKIYDKGLIGSITLKRAKKTIEFANIKNNSKVLDVGCGTGSLLFLLLKKNTSLELHGIDLSEHMLKIARIKLGSRVNLKRESIKNLKNIYPSKYFDYIFVSDALHHFPNQGQFMHDTYKLLKKGGKLIINDFNLTRLGNLIFHLLEPGNSRMPMPKEYRQILLKSKFKNIKYRPFGIISFYMEGTK